ncbi:MAG: hypothetical protein A2Z15_07840 [Chloroflexi bacterium RBG_16_50_11]|nr:MAG: hypothetical protein A2Z15_07840 [Chloroflexi bacterium RBG_16_50_11]
MHIKMIKLRAITIILSILILVGIFPAGCANDDSGYVRVTAVKRGISFSFEYPALYYKYTSDVFDDNTNDHSVVLLYRSPGNFQGKADKQIYIRPCEPLPDRPDASTWTEEHLKILKNGDPRYELIERSTIQVAGISGEMAVYNTSVLGNYLSAPYTVCRDAYIDYQGYIWKISVMAVTAIEDEVKLDFEHLIKSFKFFN